MKEVTRLILVKEEAAAAVVIQSTKELLFALNVSPGELTKKIKCAGTAVGNMIDTISRQKVQDHLC